MAVDEQHGGSADLHTASPGHISVGHARGRVRVPPEACYLAPCWLAPAVATSAPLILKRAASKLHRLGSTTRRHVVVQPAYPLTSASRHLSLSFSYTP